MSGGVFARIMPAIAAASVAMVGKPFKPEKTPSRIIHCVPPQPGRPSGVRKAKRAAWKRRNQARHK